MKRVVTLIILTILSFGLVGCANFNEKKEIENFNFTQSSLTLNKNDIYQLKFTEDIEWAQILFTVSDYNVIGVSNIGKVYAISAGTAVVEARYNDHVAKITIIVVENSSSKNPKDQVLQFSESQKKLNINQTYQLKFTENIEWTKLKLVASDYNVINVSNTGKVYAISAGTAVVEARYNDHAAKITIIVVENSSSKKPKDQVFKFLEEQKELNISQTYQLKFENEISQKVTYTSSDNAIARVSEKGVVTAINAGIVVITANSGNETTTMRLIVKKTSKVTYSLNGGTGISKLTDSCTDVQNECEVILPTATRELGNALGFSDDPNDIVPKYNLGERIKISSNKTFYLISLKTYKIRFYYDGTIANYSQQTMTSSLQNYIEKTCSIYNTSTSCNITVPSKPSIPNNYVALGFSDNPNEPTATISFDQKISVSESKDYYLIVKNNAPVLTSLNDYDFNYVTVSEKKKLRILVIEIDPILNSSTIDGKNCSGLSVSNCLDQDKNAAINELIEDLKYSSHGIIDPIIVKTEKTGEFARHTKQVKLRNGQNSKILDEETWAYYFKDGWYDGVTGPLYSTLGNYTFDYEYYINKYNLIERKNNDEFDEVWIVNVDISKTYESIMVGKTAYWINGNPITKNCENFKIMNVSISRRDVNFECMGHAAENIMSKVFNYDLHYIKNSQNVTTSNYSKLNLWQKFTLEDYINSNKNTGLSGVGNIHFSPNSESDYDWENYTNTNVGSKWQEWLDYPNMTNNPSSERFTPSVYMNKSISGFYSAARLHHRWWFYLMPHVTGYTKDGYSNNWWDYLYSNNYVVKVTNVASTYTYNVGDLVDNIKFKLKYNNNKEVTKALDKYTENMIFTNDAILGVNSSGILVAKSKGTASLKYYMDGKYATVDIIVK